MLNSKLGRLTTSRLTTSRLTTMCTGAIALLWLISGCAPQEGTTEAPPEAPPVEAEAQAETQASPAELWWGHLEALCGQAFDGKLVSQDEADRDLADQTMTMHVRRCEADRLEIPFHIGDNRSRTWVLTRTDSGIQLQHDHRHEDGSEDEVTLYGGLTDAPGSESVQSFPADDYSKKLFETHGLDVSVTNVWSMEVIPGQRFSYILRRPQRHFQADFDLGSPVEPPPAPWGHE